MKQNEITIHSFTIDSTRFPEIDFEISCSKGTYIRSIASDFGKKLHAGATLIALRRTVSGAYHIEDARTVEEWIQIIESEEVFIP